MILRARERAELEHKASTVCLMLSRYVLPATIEAEQVFRYLATLNLPLFWLDSGPDATSGFSYLGVSTDVHRATPGAERDFLHELRTQLDAPSTQGSALLVEQAGQISDRTFSEPNFQLGLVGWFSYEFGLNLLGIATEYEPSQQPAIFMRARVAVELDHSDHHMSILAESESVLADWLETHLASLLQFAQTAHPDERATTNGRPAKVDEPHWRDIEGEYLDKIDSCQRAIDAGEAYLLCLTSQVEMHTIAHPVDVYLRLRRLSPAHHGGFIEVDGTALLSSSPERFLAVDAQRTAQTKPIKGTRPRGSHAETDALLVAELGADNKERAENLMIVDLMRNDFARVCVPGTVAVTNLHEVETYEHVHQLVSTVVGQLRQDVDAIDLVEACFPAGSMTGAPKKRAAELLASLETGPRGLYSGCFGYFSTDGSADLAMVIRSIVLSESRATIGSGGGITSSSIPVDEYAELRLKADAPLSALQPPVRPVM